VTERKKAPWTIPLRDGPVSKNADRVTAGIVAVTAFTLTGFLLSVQPDGRGHGTHEAFGMERCGWPEVYGYPCPTCGCTTAACQLVHGDVLGAFVTQPFGAMIALLGLLAGVHASLCLLRGRSFVDMLVRVPFWRIVVVMILLLFAAWGYKALVWQG